MEPLAETVDSEYGDAINCGTALHGPVVELLLAEPEDCEYGDATHCGTAFKELLWNH